MKYNPDVAPDCEEWLALDEMQRIDLCERYHIEAGIDVPRLKVHAILHAIVENQIAENVEPVERAVARLVGEGLSRHHAIHAVGEVLLAHFQRLVGAGNAASDDKDAFVREIENLTARQWLSS